MLYLKVFFQSLIYSKWRGFLFVISSIILVMSFHCWELVGNYAKSFSPEKNLSPYFNVLLVNVENPAILVRKLQGVNGIDEVFIKSQQELAKTVKEGLVAAQIEQLPENMAEANYTAIKVRLAKDFSGKQISLIKEYIQGFAGVENVTFGRVVRPVPPKEELHNWKKQIFYQWGNLVVVILLGLFWVLLGHLFTRELRIQSYLIEKFQRKEFVATKALGQGFLILMIATSGMAFFLKQFHFLALVTEAILFLVYTVAFSGKWKWRK